MAGNVETIKERLDIVEVVSSYAKLEKAGINFKARCPFHSEKTASFFVSPSRQNYYCFGCGAKGDIFTIVQEMEGLDFVGSMKLLADKAGVKLEFHKSESKSETTELHKVLDDATKFFIDELKENKEAREYLRGRGISEETESLWQIGFAKEEWRSLYSYLLSLGIQKDLMLKAGLIKNPPEGEGDTKKEPYDVFRGRIIFPLRDASGKVIAFSGRALKADTVPKYLNSPDTALFRKSEVLYGLDMAKEEIRRKDYSVLVEGQIDLVLSHQSGVKNAVASSGTAFTRTHLERLGRFSKRIILAFDGDKAGSMAAYKSTVLALSLGLEVKIAKLPEGSDPASLIREDPNSWKEVLKSALPAAEHYLNLSLLEPDSRKRGKLIERSVLPLVALLGSAIEKSHFVSLITRRTGIKEEVIWEDLKKVKFDIEPAEVEKEEKIVSVPARRSRKEEYEEITEWLKENPHDRDLMRHKSELESLMKIEGLDEKIKILHEEVRRGDEKALTELHTLTKERDEERRKML